ncbi:phage/plasmid primase, P4 family [Butyricimonas hominis]|uniref:DNA primase family protein n=1 Tax=Butyricimonas TaxID=574697 RepID=UPI003518E557
MENKYTRQIIKRIYSNDLFKKLLNEIVPVDFESKYNYDEDSLNTIKSLRERLQHEKDEAKRDEILEELKEYVPGNEVKYIILIEEMLRIADELHLGIGVDEVSSFPYFYNGCYWETLSKPMAKEFIAEVAMKSGFNYYDVRISKAIEALYKQFILVEPLSMPETAKNTVKINLKNGTFVIKGDSRELVDFDKNDFFKYQLPFDFNPEARMPLFQKFLDEVLLEKESQMILQEYLGYIFARDLKLEKCLILIGSGSNGKSVIFDIVTALLGEKNVCSYTLSNLCNDSGYFRAELTNYLLNYSSELGGKGCNPDIVKKLISNEPIDARSPYGNPFILKNYGRFIFNTNLIPKDIEQTEAYFRRILPIAFNVTIPEERRDVNLARKIIDNELSGIFNWVLEGLDRLLKQAKFTESQAVQETLNKIRKETNTVAQFLEEVGYIKSTNYVLSKVLYKEYCEFCMINGHYAVSNIEFLKRLEMLGIEVKRKQTNNATWIYVQVNGQDVIDGALKTVTEVLNLK